MRLKSAATIKKERSDRAKKAAATRAANKAAAESATAEATVTTGEIVTIEDLTYTPPIRAHGADEAQARAAYEAQVELRGRHDAQAEVQAPGIQTSDLTPGRIA
jgi:hypothetical protein